jgi:hypothetical protein
VAGTLAHSWGISDSATPQQLARLEAALQPLTVALAASGGPYLFGAQPTLVGRGLVALGCKVQCSALEGRAPDGLDPLLMSRDASHACNVVHGWACSHCCSRPRCLKA